MVLTRARERVEHPKKSADVICTRPLRGAREGRVPMITITNEWKREGDGESAFVALERAVDEGRPRPVLGFHAS